MKKIEIFEPSMCCSTGVCGPSVDEKLVAFAADADWLKSQGIDVQRYNLSQSPRAFASNAVVKQALDKQGVKCLPLVVVDDTVVSRGVYPTRDQLATWASLKGEETTPRISKTAKTSPKSGGCGCGPSSCC